MNPIVDPILGLGFFPFCAACFFFLPGGRPLVTHVLPPDWTPQNDVVGEINE